MSSIKKDLLSGVFYTAIAKYSGILVSLVIAGVLARLISPDKFGIVAVVTVITFFFSIFSDLGIGAAIIQNKELQQKDLNHLFSFTVWSGCILTLLFFLCSWPISFFYEEPSMRTVTQLLAINLFFASVNIVPNALLYKAKAFKFLAWRSLGVQIIGGVIAILAALGGAGLYALIINPILSSILLFIISYRKYPQTLEMTWGLPSIRKIFKFSAYQFMFNIINYFSRNLDKLLIGKYMGMSPLGYYEKSYRLMMLPLQNITFVITPVMHPVLSDYQNDMGKLGNAHERIVRLLAFIGFPLSILLYFCSDELILLFFGNQWLPSIPVFRILSLTVGIQLILSSSGSFYQAGNDTRGMFICGVFSATASVVSILIGIFYFRSLEATAWSILISFLLGFVQCYWQLYRKMLHRSLRLYYYQLLSPIILSCIIGTALYFVTPYIKEDTIILSLIIKTLICLVLWTIYIQYSKEYNIFAKVKSILNKRKK